MKKMIGYCGLDCEKCDAFRATAADDRALRERTAQLWSELNGVTILPEQIDCRGCRGEGVKTVFCESFCAVRQCALKRKVDTCGSCPEMENCPTLSKITADAPDALKNLKGN